MAKKVVVDTDRQKGQLFRISEANGRYYVYDIEVGFIFDDRKKIGETRSLDDAIAIIKSNVRGSVRNIRIEDC